MIVFLKRKEQTKKKYEIVFNSGSSESRDDKESSINSLFGGAPRIKQANPNFKKNCLNLIYKKKISCEKRIHEKNKYIQFTLFHVVLEKFVISVNCYFCFVK